MSANADFSTPLKCLASGKKSIEQLRPSTPQQTSALELLVFYCFRILLVYPCPLYSGMLILSRVHRACPTPWLRPVFSSFAISGRVGQNQMHSSNQKIWNIPPVQIPESLANRVLWSTGR